MESLKELLKLAGINKAQLSDSLGLNIKTVYTWKDAPPQYVSAYLLAVIKLTKYEALHKAIEELQS